MTFQLKKLLTLIVALAAFGAIESHAQMFGTDCWFATNKVEVGVHTNGYEGCSVLPPYPNHYRGGTGSIGFLANSEADGWINYDGDYYLPGYPANSFGVEVGGVNYKNGYQGGPGDDQITSDGLSGYLEDGTCKFVEWDGAVTGQLDIHIQYQMDTNNYYYLWNCEVTNISGGTLTNTYFYKTFDPDNNVDVWGGIGFTTENTIVAQPTPFCPKSLVSAVDEGAWTSYVGLGAVDPNTRVARGGGLDPGDGSDIYNGTGGLVGTLGAFTADQAIAICHRIPSFDDGETVSFTFVVILSDEHVEEAILSLYHVDYDGVDGSLSSCNEILIDIDGDGEIDDPIPDTLVKDCADGPVTLELDGPYLGLGYEITWYNEETGEEVGTGAVFTAGPSDTTLYKVVADPVGDCFEVPIERYFVVAVSGIGPNVVVTDPGPQCTPIDPADLVITDLEGLPGTFMEFYTSPPDELYDPDDVWPGGPIGPDDEVYVLIGDPAGGCFDYALIELEFVDISAGADSIGYLLCNSGIENVDVDSFLVDTTLLAAGAIWEEVTPTGGAFNPITGIFDPTGLAAGDYVFRYIVLGDGVCDNDTSLHTVTVHNQPEAGIDGADDICNALGFAVDLNTLLSGHDPGGTWEEVTATGGAFNPATGVFTMDGALAAGDYTFWYILTATAPCENDTSTFVITVNALPVIGAGPDQSICIGDETSVTASSGTPGTTFVWDPVGIVNGVPFTPAVGTLTYTVTATDPNGCVSVDDLEIVVHPLPVISLAADTTQGCTDFEVEFTITSDVDIATTDWTFGDGDVALGSTLPNVTHVYTFDGLYDVGATVTDIYGCVSTIEYDDLILVENHPIAAFTFNPQSVFTNDTEIHFTNESLFSTDYIWDFADGSPFTTEEDPIHFFPDNPGDVFYPVELKASNYLGCVDSVTLFPFVKSIIIFYIPNTFTPDGDQFNEEFAPIFESGFDPYDFHMVIFNRWGEIVWESYDATGTWDGTYGNRDLVQDGVYTWQIDFKELHSDKRYTYNGTVTVLR